jgi:hypothetical protein
MSINPQIRSKALAGNATTFFAPPNACIVLIEPERPVSRAVEPATVEFVVTMAGDSGDQVQRIDK